MKNGNQQKKDSGTAADVNRAYYEDITAGKDDYWRWMAAPRFRTATVIEYLARRRPKTLVDLGCGGGNLLQKVRLEFPGIGLAGIDISQPQIAHNRRTQPDVEWNVANLDKSMEFPETLREKYDSIVATEIIEHVDEPRVFLENALELCRPGGELFISTQTGPMSVTEKNVGHIRHFTREQMSDALSTAGWEPIRVWNCGFPFHDLSKRVANLKPGWSMNKFAGSSYGPFQKVVCVALGIAFKLNSSTRGAQLFAIARRPG